MPKHRGRVAVVAGVAGRDGGGRSIPEGVRGDLDAKGALGPGLDPLTERLVRERLAVEQHPQSITGVPSRAQDRAPVAQVSFQPGHQEARDLDLERTVVLRLRARDGDPPRLASAHEVAADLDSAHVATTHRQVRQQRDHQAVAVARRPQVALPVRRLGVVHQAEAELHQGFRRLKTLELAPPVGLGPNGALHPLKQRSIGVRLHHPDHLLDREDPHLDRRGGQLPAHLGHVVAQPPGGPAIDGAAGGVERAVARQPGQCMSILVLDDVARRRPPARRNPLLIEEVGAGRAGASPEFPVQLGPLAQRQAATEGHHSDLPFLRRRAAVSRSAGFCSSSCRRASMVVL